MRLIGQWCTHGDMFSLLVLIGRGLDLLLLEFLLSFLFTLFGFQGSVLVIYIWTLVQIESVFIAMRFHLFPFRTQ